MEAMYMYYAIIFLVFFIYFRFKFKAPPPKQRILIFKEVRIYPPRRRDYETKILEFKPRVNKDVKNDQK